MLLDIAHIDTRTGFKLVHVVVRQLSVCTVALRVKIDIVSGNIGMTVFDELFHNLDNLINILRCTGMKCCIMNTQTVRIDKIFFYVFFGNFGNGSAVFAGCAYEFVIHIREVLHIGDFVTAIFKISAHHIENNKASRVADMEVIVYGRAANIHAYLPVADNKLFLAPRECIKKLHK